MLNFRIQKWTWTIKLQQITRSSYLSRIWVGEKRNWFASQTAISQDFSFFNFLFFVFLFVRWAYKIRNNKYWLSDGSKNGALQIPVHVYITVDPQFKSDGCGLSTAFQTATMRAMKTRCYISCIHIYYINIHTPPVVYGKKYVRMLWKFDNNEYFHLLFSSPRIYINFSIQVALIIYCGVIYNKDIGICCYDKALGHAALFEEKMKKKHNQERHICCSRRYSLSIYHINAITSAMRYMPQKQLRSHFTMNNFQCWKKNIRNEQLFVRAWSMWRWLLANAEPASIA